MRRWAVRFLIFSLCNEALSSVRHRQSVRLQFVARVECRGEVASVTFGQDPAAAEIARSAPVKQAQAEIDQGHPWRATQLMATVLRDPRDSVPGRVARGGARRSRMGRVAGGGEADCPRRPWLDSRVRGRGARALTRSALERGADTAARPRAAAALRDAKSEPVRAVRLTLLARAFERNNMFDSAAVAYSLAAETLRPVRAWLFLRAAGSEVDSAQRASCSPRCRSHQPSRA